MKKLLSLILALVLCFSLISFDALASGEIEETEPEAEEPAAEEIAEEPAEEPAEEAGDPEEEIADPAEDVADPAEEPVPALDGVVDSGFCGAGEEDNVTWTFTEDGTLTISGTGAMEDYSWIEDMPWLTYKYRQGIKKLVVQAGVTHVGKYTCYDFQDLTEVSLADSVTSIGVSAFAGCENLQKIEFPNRLESIGEAAFGACKRLPEIVIPDSVEEIGRNAFRECTSVTKVTLGSGIETLGEDVFLNCPHLTDIEVSDENESYYSVQGVLFSEFPWNDGSTLVKYPEGKDDVEYSIPDDVQSINYKAIVNCPKLERLYIGNVTMLGYGVFAGCSSLQAFEVSADNEKFTAEDGVLFELNVESFDWSTGETIIYPKVLVKYPTGKKGDYVIPGAPSDVMVDRDAFGYCAGLTGITLQEGVTEIMPYTFNRCVNLKQITIPATVESIGLGAFYQCTSLTDVYYGGTREDWEKIDINYEYSYGWDNDPLKSAVIHFLDGTTFVSSPYDVDRDGEITIIDAFLCLRPADTLPEAEPELAFEILQYLVGLISLD